MPRGNRLLLAAAALLLINSGYLLAARGAHLFHAAQILLHPLLGIAALKLALWSWKRIGPALRRDPLRRWFLITGGVLALSGAGLFVFGSLPATRPLLYLHLAAAAGFAGLLARRRVLAAPLVLAAAIPVGGLLRGVLPAEAPMLNAGLPPAAMAGEAMGGADGPFFPLRGGNGARRPHSRGLLPSAATSAAAATATSPPSGASRRTASPPSTTPGTAAPSSTCRAWWEPSRRSGAPAATTTRSSSAG